MAHVLRAARRGAPVLACAGQGCLHTHMRTHRVNVHTHTQIVAGQLYTKPIDPHDQWGRQYQEMLILAIHLYNIPDMEFLLHT